MLFQCTRFNQRLNLLCKIFSDALEISQFATIVGENGVNRFREITNDTCAVAIGPYAERVRALEFQKVRNLVKNVGDPRVGHSERGTSVKTVLCAELHAATAEMDASKRDGFHCWRYRP